MQISISPSRKRRDLRRNFSRIDRDVDVIPFITMKFLSQKQEEYSDKLDEFQKKYGFTFRDYELFTNIIKKYNKKESSYLSDVKSALNVLKNSKNHDIKEIFSRVDEEKITKKKLDDIMDIIDYDENLIKLFQLVNYGQETFDNAIDRIIPPTIDLLAKLATINHEVKNVYDPTSLDAQTVTSLKEFEHATLYLKNDEDYFHAKQNLLINEIPSDKVSIYNKKILIDEDDRKYDTIVSVPFEKRLKRNELEEIKKYDEYKKNPSSIHLLNLIDHLDDNGIIVTTTTQDLLVKNDALQLRKCLIENNLLDVVIDYDSGFRSNDIIILIINKNKKSEDFLFMKPKHILPGLILPTDMENIIESYENREIIPKFNNIISKDEIIKNDYNLNPKRYVYTLDYEEQSVEDIMDEQKKYSERIKELDEEIGEMLQKL